MLVRAAGESRECQGVNLAILFGWQDKERQRGCHGVAMDMSERRMELSWSRSGLRLLLWVSGFS